MSPETKKLIEEIKTYYGISDLKEELTRRKWKEISGYEVKWSKKLTEEFMDIYADKLNWNYLSVHQTFSEDFMEKHADKVDWYWISEHQNLSEDFIEKYADRVDWFLISQHQKLSEPFIEKYADKLNWSVISQYQKFSEKFIEKYSDRVSWNYISRYQKLSGSFIEKYKDKLDFYELLIKNSDNKSFIQKYENKINFYEDVFLNEDFPVEIKRKPYILEKIIENVDYQIQQFAQINNLDFEEVYSDFEEERQKIEQIVDEIEQLNMKDLNNVLIYLNIEGFKKYLLFTEDIEDILSDPLEWKFFCREKLKEYKEKDYNKKLTFLKLNEELVKASEILKKNGLFSEKVINAIKDAVNEQNIKKKIKTNNFKDI